MFNWIKKWASGNAVMGLLAVCPIQQGIVHCPVGPNKEVRLESAVYDFTDSSCVILANNLITCTNVLIRETTVRIRVRMDLKKMESYVD